MIHSHHALNTKRKIIGRIALLLLLSNNIYSQDKHNLSLTPFDLAFGTIQVSYEYAFNKNMSIGVLVGQKFSSGIITVSGFNSPTFQSEDFSFKGIKILPEFRWYVQNTNRSYTGFFIGGYYKYQWQKSPLRGIYTMPQTDTKINIDIHTNISTHTLGFQIGYKLPIYKALFADFIIAGPGYSFNTLTLKSDLNIPEFYQDVITNIREKYKDADRFIQYSEFKRNNKDRHVSAKFRLPAFRYGISIGYQF